VSNSKTWQDRHPEAAGLLMSVNLLRRQATDDSDLAARIHDILQETGVKCRPT